jgi:hypothetical protein
VTDSSGQGNTGHVINMSTSSSPVAGKMGQALNFDGTNSYIDAGSPSSLDDIVLGTPTAFSFWIYPTAQDNIIMGKNDNNSVNGGWWIENIASTPSQGVAGLRFVIEQATANLRAGVASPPNNKWTHVVVTYAGDLNASNVKFYYNDVLQSLTTNISGAGGQASDAAETMYIGLNRPSSVGFSVNKFQGKLDDVRIYNRALSASEVMQLYNLGR